MLVSVVHQSDSAFTLESDNHDKSSYDQSLYKVVTILLTIFLKLYIASLCLFYFIPESLYLLIPVSPIPLNSSPLVTTRLFSIYAFLFCAINHSFRRRVRLTELEENEDFSNNENLPKKFTQRLVFGVIV